MGNRTKERIFWAALMLASVFVLHVVRACYLANKQDRIIATIRELGGRVWFNSEHPCLQADAAPPCCESTWLRAALKRIAFLPDQVHVDLAEVSSRCIAFDSVSGLNCMATLKIGSSVPHDVLLREIRNMKDLQTLSMTGPNVSDSTLACLSGLPRLRRLSLVATNVTGNGLRYADCLPFLEELELTDSPVNDEGMKCVGGLPTLRVLGLSGTAITDCGLRELAGLDRLRFLSILGTDTTELGTSQLAVKLRRKCGIVHFDASPGIFWMTLH